MNDLRKKKNSVPNKEIVKKEKGMGKRVYGMYRDAFTFLLIIHKDCKGMEINRVSKNVYL